MAAQNKIALITGANRGIGLETALADDLLAPPFGAALVRQRAPIIPDRRAVDLLGQQLVRGNQVLGERHAQDLGPQLTRAEEAQKEQVLDMVECLNDRALVWHRVGLQVVDFRRVAVALDQRIQDIFELLLGVLAHISLLIDL